MSGEKSVDEVITDPVPYFKINTYYAAIDCTHTQIMERFIGSSDETNSKNPDQTTMGLLKHISLLSRKRFKEIKLNPKSFPVDAFNVFGQVYNKFIEHETARREYMEFCHYFDILDKCKNIPSVLYDKYQFIQTYDDSEVSLDEDNDNDSEYDNITVMTSKTPEQNVKNHDSLITTFK